MFQHVNSAKYLKYVLRLYRLKSKQQKCTPGKDQEKTKHSLKYEIFLFVVHFLRIHAAYIA